MTSWGTPRRDNATARASMCQGKQRFNSAHMAWKRVKRGGRRRKDKYGLVLEAYHCPFCGGWHLGSKT